MREIRWWSAEEIAVAQAAGVQFFPVDIVRRVAEPGLVAGR